MQFGCVACEAYRHSSIKLSGVFIIRYNFKVRPNSNYQAPWSIVTWSCPFSFIDLYYTTTWTLYSKDVIIDILYICFQIAVTWLFRTFCMALFVLSLLLCPFDISVGVGAFVIGLGPISSFLSLSEGNVDHASYIRISTYIWRIMDTKYINVINYGMLGAFCPAVYTYFQL